MSSTAVDRLRRFANRVTDHNTCDLCRSELTKQHCHLLESAHRRVWCVCDACALLFSSAKGRRFRRIPQSVTRIDLELSDQEWAVLGIPIGMAFFTVRDREDIPNQAEVVDAPVLVGYPSPAGPVMSSVTEVGWQTLLDANPDVCQMRPEVESLLVDRSNRGARPESNPSNRGARPESNPSNRGARPERGARPQSNRQQAFIVPIDVCFELIGIVRRHWQGWSGGPDVRREIDRFFDQLAVSASGGSRS